MEIKPRITTLPYLVKNQFFFSFCNSMHEFMTLAMVNVFSEKKRKKKKKLKLYNVSCNLVWSCLKQIINTDETCTFMTE